MTGNKSTNGRDGDQVIRDSGLIPASDIKEGPGDFFDRNRQAILDGAKLANEMSGLPRVVTSDGEIADKERERVSPSGVVLTDQQINEGFRRLHTLNGEALTEAVRGLKERGEI
jgi:hypothetical protein